LRRRGCATWSERKLTQFAVGNLAHHRSRTGPRSTDSTRSHDARRRGQARSNKALYPWSGVWDTSQGIRHGEQ
jgi:hypothetical protein